ncbi:MAG: hypothetical protein ACRCWO_09995 [Bosea sp. (in: a-proteobacteria)]
MRLANPPAWRYVASMITAGTIRILGEKALAFLLAYALAFAPALATAHRGLHQAHATSGIAAKMGELCLTRADGGRTALPASESPHDNSAHEDCCLAGCRLLPLAVGHGDAQPLAGPITTSTQTRLAHVNGAALAAPCPPPPATGPPEHA